jgi:hypothetical protein
MDDFGTINVVYEKFFGNHKPARSAVEVARLPKDVLFEIECIARYASSIFWPIANNEVTLTGSQPEKLGKRQQLYKKDFAVEKTASPNKNFL